MDFSRSIQWVMARGIYGTQSQMALTLASLLTPPSLSSSVSLLSSQILASTRQNRKGNHLSTSPKFFPPIPSAPLRSPAQLMKSDLSQGVLGFGT
jgi:hypothetical protein